MKKYDNLTIRQSNKNPLPVSIIGKYGLDKCIFIDIECTGFSKEEDGIFCISIGKLFDDRYEVTVCFNPYDEANLLNEVEPLLRCENICTFNGIAFDEPFINARLKKYNIDEVSYKNHYDFYRILQPYTKGLGSKGCSLKSFEELVGISRIDEIDGKECRDKFLLYLEQQDETLVKAIIQHNLEDVLELPKLFLILNKIKSENILRDDALSINEIRYISRLIQKRNIIIEDIKFNYLSTKDSRRLIYQLRQKIIDYNEIDNILKANHKQAKIYE
ncbi:ribonuclease H-like domain-containing protein [Inconstantimicrobium mannanitabidum]|uniref:Uncharacterized protein n=1 Tax=Inconstantimicrobium mannanitabidum TaxID=1604901 RepID=A0ACB5RDA4_9CLOT|nr:ribonuclease H-like domain-containing protein [Clostridium sp. TW13]GKX66782.1 hypothetical protein rsdtw13_20400 [Clostridium sp. TW13]